MMKLPRMHISGAEFAVAGLLAVSIGALIPLFTALSGNSVAPVLMLPAVFVFLSILIYSRLLLLLLILVFRSVGDYVFEATRFSLGGYMVGIGGLINAFVILIVMLLVVEKPRIFEKYRMTSWLPFLGIALIGVVASPQLNDAVRAYLSLLSYFAVFVSAFYFMESGKRFDSAVEIVLWSSALPVLYGVGILCARALGLPLGSPRLQSTFSHANIFAFYLTVIIALTLYAIKSQSMATTFYKKAGLVLYILVLIALLLATKTRSAWSACVILFVGYGLFVERRYLVYIIIATAAMLLLPEVRERISDAGSIASGGAYAKLNSFSWRLRSWEASLAWMQADHYLLGYGMSAFRYYSLQFSPFIVKSEFDPHNVYVQLFFDLGIFGLGAYLLLHCKIIQRLFVRPKAADDRLVSVIAGALIAAYLAMSISDNVLGYLVFNWYFWFVIGAACAALTSQHPSGRSRRSRDAQACHPERRA